MSSRRLLGSTAAAIVARGAPAVLGGSVLALAAGVGLLAAQARDSSAAISAVPLKCPAGSRPVIDTAALIIYVSALDTLSDTLRRSLAQLDAQALADHFQAPPHLTTRRWPLPWDPDATSLHRDTWGREDGLAGDLTLIVDRRGHLLDAALGDSTVAPELRSAVIAAARRADSLGALASAGSADSALVLPIYLGTDARLGRDDVPLMRVNLPYTRVTAPARVRHLSRPPWPRDAVPDGRDGYTVLEFVVDEQGRPVPATLGLVGTRSGEFIQPAAEAIVQATFDPAESGGCHVRQLVEQRVGFGKAPDIGKARPSKWPGDSKQNWPPTHPVRGVGRNQPVW